LRGKTAKTNAKNSTAQKRSPSGIKKTKRRRKQTNSGKLLNVRDATAQQVSDNAEINHIKRILGLQHGKIYTDERTLQTLR